MRYRILKSFAGSQDGTTAEDFEAGTEAELSDYLAGCVHASWVEPVAVEIDNKAVITEGKQRRTKADK